MQNSNNLIEIETQKVYELILKNKKDRIPFIVAIDGKALSGKTTIANNLRKYLDATIIHLDDYFLRKSEQNNYSKNGRLFNIDYRRFIEEVITPINEHKKSLVLNKFSCKEQKIISSTLEEIKEVVIIEGTYSLDNKMLPYYNLKFFFEIDDKTQLARIRLREKENADNFIAKWVKNEQIYFSETAIKEIADYIIKCE